ncbi:MAG: YbgC/FadM family acyl-CoA thioesterase, partial [Sedimenticolaceae bacterium]
MSLFEWPVRVYYEDTDAGGVVYYANYLKYLERARTEWLRYLGFGQDTLMRDAGILFAVRRVEIDYLLPARFDDALLVELEIEEIG